MGEGHARIEGRYRFKPGPHWLPGTELRRQRQTAAERAVDNARRYATVARSEIEINLIYAEHQVRRTPYAGQRP